MCMSYLLSSQYMVSDGVGLGMIIQVAMNVRWGVDLLMLKKGPMGGMVVEVVIKVVHLVIPGFLV